MNLYQEGITEVKGNLIQTPRGWGGSYLEKKHTPMFGTFSKIRKRGIEYRAENDTAVSDESGFKASGLTLVPASLTVKLDSKSRLGTFHALGAHLRHALVTHYFLIYISC